MAENKTVTMRMAKASKADINEITRFFNLWEYLVESEWCIDALGDDDEDKKHLTEFSENGIVDPELFFQKWYRLIDFRWRRVVLGCDLLIDNCCDPEKDYLAIKEDFANDTEKFTEGKKNLILERPAICFDIESTGTDVVEDQIIELGIIKIDPQNLFPDQRVTKYLMRFNPGRHIPEESTKVHGITDEDVANEPFFGEKAEVIKSIFAGCDVIGYNSNRFDVPMLVEKMLSLDIEIFSKETQFIDAQTIFMKKEERTLSAAVRVFLGREHKDAHSALADAEATWEILNAEIEQYPEIGNTVPQLAKYSIYGDKPIIDYAGKLVYNAEGVACYNIGKAKGTPVQDDPGFGEWMLNKEFPLDTKQKLRSILYDVEEETDKEEESYF
jgi:DNA polymerase-3 subunit epsilon